MNSMIYNPLEEYDNKFKSLHSDNANGFFEELVKRSQVDPETNRLTVKQYEEVKESIAKLKKKLNLWRFLRVLMIITLILIPLVIIKTTPKIRGLRSDIELAGKKAAELLDLAHSQMVPLNSLFTDRDALKIIEKTIPLVSFADCFTAEQEMNMRTNFDFSPSESIEESAADVLAGNYNENPFIFENKLTHRMGLETYHGYKTIHWTERYRGSDGKMHSRTRSQTLHATVTKPKPFYSTQVVLNYCAQGGPELCFTRDASHLDRKDDKEIERYIKKGEKKLKKKTDEAIKENSDFMSMSNTDFEVLFDALDRNNEVQFRTLFTPLAQTNMVDLIRSDVGYGDDFNFIKQNRTNKIISKHSQGRAINLVPEFYFSYSFDIIKQNFTSKNEEFFKAVYFDLAPLLAIPMYQERPVHSLDPLPDLYRLYSSKECEALANKVDPRLVTHPRTKTQAILKTSYEGSENSADKIKVNAYSYDIEKRVDFIPMLGGDGRMHSVAVPWDEYIALEASNGFLVANEALAQGKNVAAKRNNLCIFN